MILSNVTDPAVDHNVDHSVWLDLKYHEEKIHKTNKYSTHTKKKIELMIRYKILFYWAIL